MHTWLVQSDPARHILPGTQAGQRPPPQSTSVSVPFLMPSVQVGAPRVVLVVLVVVVVGTISGAQSSFAPTGVTGRVPN